VKKYEQKKDKTIQKIQKTKNTKKNQIVTQNTIFSSKLFELVSTRKNCKTFTKNPSIKIIKSTTVALHTSRINSSRFHFMFKLCQPCKLPKHFLIKFA